MQCSGGTVEVVRSTSTEPEMDRTGRTGRPEAEEDEDDEGSVATEYSV